MTDLAAIRERVEALDGMCHDGEGLGCETHPCVENVSRAAVLALLADTPSVEPPTETLIQWLDSAISHGDDHGAEQVGCSVHMLRLVRERVLRPSVEPLDVERLAEALKEYDAGRLRVPFAPSHVLSPDQSPSRFHRAWAKTLLDYAARLLADTPSVEPGGLRAQIETLMAESISEGKKAAAPDIAIRWDVMTRTYAKVLALLPTQASDSPESQ